MREASSKLEAWIRIKSFEVWILENWVGIIMVTFFLFKYKHVNLSGNSKIIIINELECIYYHEIIYSFKEYIWDAFLQNKFLSKDKCKELRKVAQMIKNLPSMQETWVRSLVWEYFLEKGMTTNSSILAWRIPWQRSLVGHSPWGCRVRHDWASYTFTFTRKVLKWKNLEVPNYHLIHTNFYTK